MMRRLWPALLAGLMILSACGGRAASDQPARDTAAAQADLGFTVATVDGGTFDGRSLAGKPAVLWFWAPWCPSCVAQAPSVKQAATVFAGKANIVGVAGLGDEPAMRRFLELTQVDNMPHLADAEGVVWKRFGITAQSTFVVLDSAGRVVHRGHLGEGELERKLAPLVG